MIKTNKRAASGATTYEMSLWPDSQEHIGDPRCLLVIPPADGDYPVTLDSAYLVPVTEEGLGDAYYHLMDADEEKFVERDRQIGHRRRSTDVLGCYSSRERFIRNSYAKELRMRYRLCDWILAYAKAYGLLPFEVSRPVTDTENGLTYGLLDISKLGGEPSLSLFDLHNGPEMNPTECPLASLKADELHAIRQDLQQAVRKKFSNKL